MENVTKVLDPNTDLYLVGDTHAGSRCFLKAAFENTIADIEKNPKAKVILMGDLMECIRPHDPRFDAELLDPNKAIVDQQIDYIEQALMPIRSKIIGIHKGNHEHKLSREGINPIQRVIKTLNLVLQSDSISNKSKSYEPITYLKNVASLNFNIKSKGKKKYKNIYGVTAHKFGGSGGGTVGSKINQSLKPNGYFVADFYACGHVHTLQSTVQKVIYNDHGTMKQKMLRHILTGHYLDTYTENETGYGEMAGYPPNFVGYAKILIRDGKIPNNPNAGVELVRFWADGSL